MSFRISLASKFERNHGPALSSFCIPENTKSGQDSENNDFQKPFHLVLLYAADAKMSLQGQLANISVRQVTFEMSQSLMADASVRDVQSLNI